MQVYIQKAVSLTIEDDLPQTEMQRMTGRPMKTINIYKAYEHTRPSIFQEYCKKIGVDDKGTNVDLIDRIFEKVGVEGFLVDFVRDSCDIVMTEPLVSYIEAPAEKKSQVMKDFCKGTVTRPQIIEEVLKIEKGEDSEMFGISKPSEEPILPAAKPAPGNKQVEDKVRRLCNHGRGLFQGNKFDEAIDTCHKVFELDPNNVKAWLLLGESLLAKNDVTGAIDADNKVIEIDPKKVDAWLLLADSLLANNDATGALDACHKALKIDPEYVGALNKLGIALYATNDFDGAIAAYRKAIERKRGYSTAWSNLGKALQAINDIDGAIDAFEKANGILGYKNCTAWKDYANALQAKNDVDGAIKAYYSALKLDPSSSTSRKNFGDLLLAKKNAGGDISEYEAVLELDTTRKGFETVEHVKEKEQMRIDKIARIIKVSDSLSLEDFAIAMEITRENLMDKIFTWAEMFGFRIADDKVIFAGGRVDAFLADLDRQFAEWSSKEKLEDGKV